MPTRISNVVQHLRRAILQHDEAGLTDGQLLGRFIEQRDEAAVAALVRRHGPMIWGVCRRILRTHHDAEDAFQATFLVLVRKAGSVRKREMVGNWLYGVAHQTALKARATAAKRLARERQVVDMPDPAVKEPDRACDLQAVLDQELSHLPDKYRVGIVLCDLEGKTRKEAARQLDLPEGTLAGRLTRGRAMLAKRLARNGLAVSGGTLATVLAQQAASGAVPTSVMTSTIKVVGPMAAGQAANGLISAKVAALTEGMVKAMFLSKLKSIVAVVLVLGFVATGATILTGGTAAGQEDKKPTAEKPVAPAAKQEKDKKKEAVTAGDKGDAEAPKKTAPKTDEEKLQGIWKLVRMEAGGQVANEEETSHGPEIIIDRNRIENDKGKQPAPFPWGAFTLDATKNPKKITLITDFDGARYPSKGVYELDGDDLKICIDFNHVGYRNYKETTELKTIPGSLSLLYSFKRVQAKKEDLPKEKKTPAKIRDLKADLTAWGKEVGGLQAGLGFRPGEHRAYHYGETVTLVIQVRNVSMKEVTFQYWPESDWTHLPDVTDAKGKPIAIKRGLMFPNVSTKKVNLAPGKSMELWQWKLNLRPESERTKPPPPDDPPYATLHGPGKFVIQYPWVSSVSKLATGKLELEVKSDPPQKQEQKQDKDGNTAWGNEVGGLQAGLRFLGEKRAYHHGETVTLVVRVRNVGKETVKFTYIRQFLDENPPTVTDANGKTVPRSDGIIMEGFHVPVEVSLEPGKEIQLESRLPLRYELRPTSDGAKTTADTQSLLVGTGKVSLQLNQVIGNSSSGRMELDPVLTKLGTGKLELEVKADPPEKKVPQKPEPGDQTAKKFWAGMSVNQPLFRAGQDTNLLQFSFALVNESDKVIDPKIPGYPRLIVNGTELDLSSIPGTGPRDGRFKALSPGDNLQFGMGAARFFDKPGIYRVYWQGEEFRSNEVVFRVLK